MKNIHVVSILIVAGMFMTLLDTTIVDIALPHMMAAFDVKEDDIQWVITSYMIASAIAMPTVGYLGGRIGHRNTYVLGIGLFTLMSTICGMAPNLSFMVVSRILQGIGEGLAIPTAMVLLFEIYPPEKRGLAMGLFGLGATFGPAMGPTLGGYLTEHFGWRSIFYVNVIPGILVVYLMLLLMKNERETKVNPFDTLGFGLLVISLSSLITALSKGNDWGWHDPRIVVLFYVFIVSTVLFIYRELMVKHPLLDLRLFRFKFFRYPVITLSLFGMGTYASYFLLPMFLERLRGFQTINAGEILFYPAMLTGIVGVLSGILMDKKVISKKTSILIGISIFIFGTYLQQKLDLDMGKHRIILQLLPWGFGMGMFFPALSQISLGNFKGEMLRHASALQNLLRLVFGSVGTTITTYILINRTALHLERISDIVSPVQPQFTYFSLNLKTYLHFLRSVQDSLLGLNYRYVVSMLYNQHAYWHAFSDGFFFATLCGIISLGFAVLIKEGK